MVMREVANLNDSFTRSISRRFYLSAKKKKKQIFAVVGKSDQGRKCHVTLIVCVTIILVLHSLLLSR